ncbi:Phophatidylserine decarboxylase-domain-containing protein [Pisolithus tinctorius]|uniref:L-tryptophan decarboxylase PsiD-like domain-containing protein n=1 Tax=Pisolithus tinctorius Marx 270 TaxID=870435 RepID=A0A0C3PY74_PISTI|nr:Phophatidylserine decarboxylase-domain-containing protein [Pisolithus tinctorius]KIO14521.1 hypothetical protein M404DRAFT_928249 [Pisolithus tinctorius Marx 270]
MDLAVFVLAPVVQEFKNLIEEDGAVYTAFDEMFRQAAARKPRYIFSVFVAVTPLISVQVEDYVELMLVINTLLLTPPRYGLGPSVMASSVPFYAVISRFCNTHAGYEAFTNPRVNANLCGVFTAWRTFLESPGSRVVLGNGPGGWFSDDALRAMVESAGGGPDQTFQDFYVCIPDAAHYNFTSYDNFFTRELRPDQVIPPDGDSSIVRSACSSTVHSFYTGLRKTERFCIKNTPYSLRHILAGDDAVDTFVGGTLLQAMLGCTDYHRWHSPVNGTVVRTRLISGTEDPPSVPHPTYFAGLLDGEHKDPDVITRSQDFVTAISTRALIFIEAQEPIGLMCFVAVGLCEVSTCDITVSEGDPLVKGTPLGTFRFGGSTHCLIFRRGLNVTPINPNLVKSKVQVGQNILNVAAQV